MVRLFLLAPACLLLTGCLEIDFHNENFKESFHFSYDLEANGTVSIDTHNGEIEVVGQDDNKVEIDGEKYASNERDLKAITIHQQNTPSKVQVDAGQSDWLSNTGVRFRVRVPKQAQVNATTSNGRITVREISGAAQMHTSNGRIEGEQLSGKADAETSNGRIELSYSKPPTGEIRARSSNGLIRLRLPEGSNAHIDAAGSNSRVTSEFNLRGRVREEHNHLEGDLGNGGPLVSLTTSNGSISIQKGF